MTASTPFSSLRFLSKWLSGIVRNKNDLTPNDYFAWPKYGGRTSFLWKGCMVQVSTIRQMPSRSIQEVEVAFRALYDYATPGWRPDELRERVKSGLRLDPSTYFLDPVDSIESFIDHPSNDLLPFRTALLEVMTRKHTLTLRQGQKILMNTELYVRFLKLSSNLNQVSTFLYISIFACSCPLFRH